MRLNAFFTALVLAGFTFGAAADPAPPATSVAAPPHAADLSFLATLADAPSLPDLGVPAPLSLTCNVSNDCGDGNIAYCEGNSSCQTTISGVKCDGNAVDCPNFCSIALQCDCCNGTQTGVCWSKKGNCHYTSEGAVCGDHTMTCDTVCPFCPEW